MWTVHCPEQYLGNSAIIEGEDGLVVYDTGVNLDAGARIRREIDTVSDKPVRSMAGLHATVAILAARVPRQQA